MQSQTRAKLRAGLLLFCVVAVLLGAVAWAVKAPIDTHIPGDSPRIVETAETVPTLDQRLQIEWTAAGANSPAEVADDLLLLRRLSLALHGTIPSLEEIRRFEADTQPDRIARWTAALLRDRRFADYFAERLARSLVGTDDGQFVIFRRDRFIDWLSQQLHNDLPYDELVRRMVAGRGLWTGTPETNFLTAGFNNDRFDENKLTGRTVRAFLGQRIDCAQCHDAVFADWKQTQFQGLAAFYGQTRLSLDGVIERTHDKQKPVEYRVDDLSAVSLNMDNSDDGELKIPQKVISPAVPFGEDWLPSDGTRRERLAAWITHSQNRRFDRAIANRIWGLLLGRPYKLPVDDMPDPPAERDLLDVIADDFVAHDRDLKRMVLLITQSRAFRVASLQPTLNETEFWQHETAGAIFPVTRLRPEQLIGAMLQASSVRTIDRNSNFFVRAIRLLQERGFVDAYGDAGDNELEERAATISQALLRMNGRLSNEVSAANPFTASGRVVSTAGSDEKCLDVLFLLYLTRRPTTAEQAALLPQLRGTKDRERQRAVEDIVWALVNSEEFSWNH